MGASTVAHDGTRQARGAMGGGLGGSGDAMGSRGGAENINLHFSEGATHEIPEWVLEPASGQVWTSRLSPHSRCELCMPETCASLRLVLASDSAAASHTPAARYAPLVPFVRTHSRAHTRAVFMHHAQSGS
jgi:hypothetical protein